MERVAWDEWGDVRWKGWCGMEVWCGMEGVMWDGGSVWYGGGDVR